MLCDLYVSCCVLASRPSARCSRSDLYVSCCDLYVSCCVTFTCHVVSPPVVHLQGVLAAQALRQLESDRVRGHPGRHREAAQPGSVQRVRQLSGDDSGGRVSVRAPQAARSTALPRVQISNLQSN